MIHALRPLLLALLAAVLLPALAPAPAAAQSVAAPPDTTQPDTTRSATAESAWKPLLTHEGLVFSYLFYRQASGDNVAGNGVVLRLQNTNAHAVAYRFEMIFRTEGDERVEMVDGRLEPGEGRTGSADGLFWVPFPDGRIVAEVGLRGYRVEAE